MTVMVTGILVLLLAWGVFAYNRLVRLRNQVRTAWADIDVQLTRRHDLVPQLVGAVKGYADHERTVLDAVTALRSQAVGLNSPARLAEVEASLEQALGRLFALKEAYPDPSDESGKFVMVDVKAVGKMPKPVTLAQVKATSSLKDMALIRLSRLSVQPVTEKEWSAVCRMGGAK